MLGAHMAASENDGIAAEVLHEIKQPLLGLKAYLQLVRDDPARPIPVTLLLAQVERIEQIVGDFHRLTNDRPAPLSPLKLSGPVRQAVAHFASIPSNVGARVEVQVVFDVELMGNARLLEQLTLNLINNARDAMGGKGTIKVLVTHEALKPALYVADWGPGIPPAMRETIFEPYVTTKSTGSGLGLAVCQRIATEHQARLDLAPSEVLGESPPPATVFRVIFSSRPAPAPDTGTPRRRVLVVDDEAVIRLLFKDLLSKDYDCTLAATAEEALDPLKAGSCDLLICDKNLPGISGLELAREAKARWPQLKVMLMTGYPSLVTAQQSLELGLVDYLVKPFDDIKAVRELIREAVNPIAPAPAALPAVTRVDIYEDNPTNARQIVEAVRHLGYEPQVLTAAVPGGSSPPAAIVLSWDFQPAQGRSGLAFVKQFASGVPFIVLAEHLTMESALQSLRGGATACLPKLLTDALALSKELQRALRLPER